jgi:hypothetical protein
MKRRAGPRPLSSSPGSALPGAALFAKYTGLQPALPSPVLDYLTYGEVVFDRSAGPDETVVAVYDRKSGLLQRTEHVGVLPDYSALELRTLAALKKEMPEIGAKARDLIKEQRDRDKKHERARLACLPGIRTCPHFNNPIECITCARCQEWILF